MKSPNLHIVIGSFIFLIIIAGYQYYLHSYTPVSLPGLPELKQNERRPDFVLPDITGKKRSHVEWDGKIVVINFWATWCRSCLKEMPILIRLQNEYAKQGVQFIGIAVRDELDSVKRVATVLGINYPILFNQQGLALSKAFGNTIEAIPFTVVVDRQGYIVSRFAGELNERAAKKLMAGQYVAHPTTNN
ncbi:MAG TPA: TlpA family protein disulfide reductase [Thiotrichaceae bacterium]|nr:TlpA family protein disulfide reductase [Thiotrichaceae bacterium]